MKKFFLTYLAVISCAVAASRVEKVRNERVIAYEVTLEPAEAESGPEELPSLTVFLTDGTILATAPEGRRGPLAVKRGEVFYQAAGAAPLRAVGTTEMRFVRIEFPGKASTEVWGTRGYPPSYRTLVENGYVRAYDIHMKAGGGEPLHTHHDRIVVCLSGAELRHVLPDGKEQDSTLKTGECVWRLGQTHIGRNIGKTDLWVIAVEPK